MCVFEAQSSTRYVHYIEEDTIVDSHVHQVTLTMAYNFKQAYDAKVDGAEKTMRALRFHGQKDIRLDQIPIPLCGKGQVKVKPAFVGICGTGTSTLPSSKHVMLTHWQ